MNRILLVCVLVLAGATWAFGDQLIINFTELTSLKTSIYLDNLQANTGADASHKIGGPASAGGVAYPLYYCNLSALAGATIDCATFYTDENWWNVDLPNTQLRRIVTPFMWQKGTGTWNDRWGGADSGVGLTMVDWDNIAQTGHDWSGAVRTSLAWANPDIDDCGIAATVYDTQTLVAGSGGTWLATAMVQGWASGTFENKGFLLYPGLSSGTNNDQLVLPLLTIDYTPAAIPEPGTMALIGTGAVGFLAYLRRRRMK